MKRKFQASFHGFQIDSISGLTHDKTGDIPLPAKELAVLVELVVNAGKLVTKEQLVKAVWGDYSASDSSIARCISAIKTQLKKAEPNSGTLIRMVYGKGYKFTGAVSTSSAFLCEESFATLIDASPDCIIFKNGEGRWLAANRTALDTFGLNNTEWQGKTDMELAGIMPITYRSSFEACTHSDALAWQQKLPSRHFETVCLNDGSKRIFDTVKSPLYNKDGSRNLLVVFGHDVTEILNAVESRRVTEQVLANSNEAILITDTNNKIVSINRAFSELTGYSEEEVLGKNPSILTSAHHDAAFFHDMWLLLSTEGKWQGEIYNRKKSGEVYRQILNISTVNSRDGIVSNYIANYSYPETLNKVNEEIGFLAYHDPLTRLPNRLLLLDRFNHAIASAQREGSLIAIFFIDLDKFKYVNDTLGHEAGDHLLTSVAQRLEQCVRKADTVSRYGGDEFVVLLTDIHTEESIVQVAQKIVDEMAKPVAIGTIQIATRVSVGIAVYPNDGHEINALLRMADVSMYRAKNAGRSNFRFFSSK